MNKNPQKERGLSYLDDHILETNEENQWTTNEKISNDEEN